MQQLSAEGRRIVEDVAQRHGVSTDAAATLLMALAAGQGTQAQFSHPELGGMGQWSQGGMIMVGDMFNNGLKARVDALCNELSNALRSTSVFAAPRQSQSQSQGGQGQGFQAQGFQAQGGGAGVSLFVPGAMSSGSWWPEGLGNPSSTGAQNNLRYALFPASRRLAIDQGGRTTVYDTGDHQIGGFSQQQGGDQSLTFTSQHGLVRVADLAIVPAAIPEAERASPPPRSPEPTPPAPAPQMPPASPTFGVGSVPEARPPVPKASPPAASADDIFAKIERLAELRQKGILTDDEFTAKKTELLSRL